MLEEYLKWRWGTMPTNLGACPTGAGSVAKMRLVLMAQGDSLEILRQFRLLPKSDANILSKDGVLVIWAEFKPPSVLIIVMISCYLLYWLYYPIQYIGDYPTLVWEFVWNWNSACLSSWHVVFSVACHVQICVVSWHWEITSVVFRRFAVISSIRWCRSSQSQAIPG